MVYEHRKYEYDWDQEGAAENQKPDENQPYPVWQQTILDPNHYNDVVAVKFGHVLIEDMQQAKKFGHAKMLMAMGRDFEKDGPIVCAV